MNIVRKLNRSVDSLKLQGLKVSDIVLKLKNKFREYFITVEHHKTITTGFSITAYHHCEKQKSSLFVCSKSDWRLKKKEYDYIKKHVDDDLCLNKLSDIKSEFMLYKRKYK